ncbi:hypothetical protein [Chlamydiifrater phoenicopteri]|uniref:hypothetical protein n=1 Tax=Chlamydiifrater phoenicopteri TaxID=2681469 RepID=UPI001BD07A42|nr:hypothetical protein [Chlamydiifrater phoenicopteri]
MSKILVFLSLLGLVFGSTKAFSNAQPIICPFPVEAPTAVDNEGTSIFLSYESGLSNARENNKPLIVVLFSKEPSTIFSPFFSGNISFGESVDSLLNIVVLQPSLISPLIYPPKIDPMIFRIADFQRKFADACDFLETSYIFVVDSESEDLLFQMAIPSSLSEDELSVLDLLKDVFKENSDEE